MAGTMGANRQVLATALLVGMLAGNLRADQVQASTSPWGQEGLFGQWRPEDEIVRLRTENSKTFDNHDGTRSVVIAGPVHREVAPGVWAELPVDEAELHLTLRAWETESSGTRRGFDTATSEIGQGSDPTTCMWNITSRYYRCQHLYLADELDFEGTIIELAFRTTDADTDYLMHSHHWLRDLSVTCFTSDTWETPDTEVWSGDLACRGTGWLGLHLTTPFYHASDSNLLVSYRHRDGTPEPVLKYYRSSDYPTSPCRGKWGEGDSDTLPAMTMFTQRANIRITYVLATPTSDVQTIRISAPAGQVNRGQPCFPQAIVRNNGSSPDTFAVKFDIADGYSNIKIVSNLAPGFDTAVTFSAWIPDSAGTFALKCSTQLSGDQNPSNDKQSGLVVVRLLDAEAVSILAPAGTVDSGASIVPQATVRNNGNVTISFGVGFTIAGGYSSTQTVANLSAGETRAISFSPWTATPRGGLAMKCTTMLDSDMVPSNDRQSGTVLVRVRDVGVSRVVGPAGDIPRDSSILPGIAVRNYGTNSDTLAVLARINRGPLTIYADSQSIALPSGAAKLCSLRLWHADSTGDHEITAFTRLPGDMNRHNDTAHGSCHVFYRDIGIEEIVAPRDTIAWGSSVTPRVRIRNLGSEPETLWVWFQLSRNQNCVRLDSARVPVPAGETLSVSFGSWQADTGSFQTVACTRLAGDRNRDNDSLTGTFTVLLHDVGATSIFEPLGVIDWDSTVTPRAKLRNYGNAAESSGIEFHIRFGENTVYIASVQIAVGARESLSLAFTPWQPDTIGDYGTTAFSRLAGDQRHENDTARGSFRVQHVLLHDVGVTRILDPHDSVAVDSVIRPRARVRNFGRSVETFSVAFALCRETAQVYCDTVWQTLYPGESTLVDTFSRWTAFSLGSYTAFCRTLLSGDLDPANDTTSRPFIVFRPKFHDVGVQGIIAPAGEGAQRDTVVPAASLFNFGDFTERFSVHFMIADSTGSRIYVRAVAESLGPGQSATASFPPWVFLVTGSYSARCSVYTPADRDPGNDAMTRSFAVLIPSPWRRKGDLPAGAQNRYVRSGAALTADNDLVYALKGNRTREFYAYHPAGDSWVVLGNIPGQHGVHGGGALCYCPGPGGIYAVKGGNSAEFWMYSPDTDSWQRLADVPAGPTGRCVGTGASLAAPNAGPVYLLKGGSTRELCVYDPARNEWQSRATIPAGSTGRACQSGSCLVAVRDYLYLIKSFDNELYAYSTQEDTWYSRNPLPMIGLAGKRRRARAGTALTRDNDLIYALKGGRAGELWRYCTFGDTWDQLEDLPRGTGRRSVADGGALVWSHGRLWALKGNNTRELWQYQPSGKSEVRSMNYEVQSSSFIPHNSDFRLQIAPNPFSGAVTITYSLLQPGPVTLELRDITGRVVRMLVSGNEPAGTRRLTLRSDLPKGVYFLKLRSDEGCASCKIVER